VSEQGGSAAAAPGENGNGAEPGGLYQEALQGVPQELRGYVEPVLKQWDQKVNPRLQEAAELRKQFEPLSQVEGLADIAPDNLKELVDFHQLLSNPDAASVEDRQALVGQIAQLLGVQAGGDLSEDQWVQMGTENGWFEGEDGGNDAGGGLDENALVQKVIEALRPEIEPVKQFMGKQEQSQQAEKDRAQLEARMGEVLGELGDIDDDAKAEASRAITELAWAFVEDDDPIGKAFERFKQITGRAQGDLVDRKLQQPNGALSGGRTSTEQPKLSWNGGGLNPKEAALERMKA
jgi:hypothetical protein